MAHEGRKEVEVHAESPFETDSGKLIVLMTPAISEENKERFLEAWPTLKEELKAQPGVAGVSAGPKSATRSTASELESSPLLVDSRLPSSPRAPPTRPLPSSRALSSTTRASIPRSERPG